MYREKHVMTSAPYAVIWPIAVVCATLSLHANGSAVRLCLCQSLQNLYTNCLIPVLKIPPSADFWQT